MVLDRCLTEKQTDQDGSTVSHYNFEFIEDTYARWSNQAILKAEETMHPKTLGRFVNGRGKDAGFLVSEQFV